MDTSSEKIALFSSGSGSNAQKIMEYFENHQNISVQMLLSNNPDAFALQRAKKFNVATRVFNRQEFYHSDNIVQLLMDQGITWIVLAGFLWLVPENLIKAFENKIVNIHPALLPKFGGKGMYGMRVHQAVVAAGEDQSGISIHLVNPAYDEGHMVFQATCAVLKTDSPEDVARKVQELEHQHFPTVIEKLIISH